ncbi:tetratricopeptide repeat protein [Roseomonas sp. NAR14]|uniref:Tetratricopeptide repeat protein n=1 Tax=Roseomonas acroporae TaxID=2937791 RepID=A0A9X2BX65_9PROT|nr:tetratricopeptide repeat protein [Roseomonas acroporae]MCK8784665.1 tetratricopeptide repeat protein [Roseomonas acroporae]
MHAALSPRPPHAPAAVPPDVAVVERLFQRACDLMQQGRHVEALPALDRLRRVPTPPPMALGLRAEALLALGRTTEAVADVDDALAADPGSSALLQLRSRARRAGGDRTGALDDAAAAVLADSASPAAKALLGTALLEQGQHDEAVFLIGAALRADPANPQYRFALARALSETGHHDAAEEILSQHGIERPDLPVAALRAQNALAADRPDLAAALAREALASRPADASLHAVLAHALMRLRDLDGAAAHLLSASRLRPEDGYLAHLAAALNGDTTEQGAEAYATALFDRYAPSFELSLLSLGWRGPGLVRRALERLRPGLAAGTERLGPVLDLGCGTGLVGVALSDLLGGGLTGVDLSARMLEQAARKGVYTALRQANLMTVLREAQPPCDVIVAADVLIYLGQADEMLALCRRRLAPDGLLLFTVERGADTGMGWHLERSARFSHGRAYLERALAAAALDVVEMREEVLRLEDDGMIDGLLVAARPAPSGAAH